VPPFSVLGPPGRLAVLTHTFVDPAREVHLRELVRLTGLAPRSVYQEVERLIGAGILAERRSGNRRYLHANERHPLFRPIREIVLKTTGLADVLRQALGTQGIDLALVFGSIAADAPKAGSDVDLLIIGSIGLREAVRRLSEAQEHLGREVNPVVWTRSELQRRRKDGDAFLRRIARAPVIPVVGEEALLAE
jgi:predicted nucleotidyltransferase